MFVHCLMWVRYILSLTEFHKLTLLLLVFFSFRCFISIWSSSFSMVKFQMSWVSPFSFKGLCKLFKFEKLLDCGSSMVLQVRSGLDLIMLMLLYFSCILIIYIRLLDFLSN